MMLFMLTYSNIMDRPKHESSKWVIDFSNNKIPLKRNHAVNFINMNKKPVSIMIARQEIISLDSNVCGSALKISFHRSKTRSNSSNSIDLDHVSLISVLVLLSVKEFSLKATISKGSFFWLW